MQSSVFEWEIMGTKVFAMDTTMLELEKDYPGLSEYRKRKISSIRSEGNKKQSLGAELLLIYAVKKYYPRITLPLEFLVSDYGKPAVKGVKDFHFSLAHSYNVSVLAIAQTDVGIDIENKHRTSSAIAEKYFSPRERESEFCHVWTRKEAVAKAEGTGIGLGLDTFDVTGDTVCINGIVYRLSSFDTKINDSYASLCVKSDAVCN